MGEYSLGLTIHVGEAPIEIESEDAFANSVEQIQRLSCVEQPNEPLALGGRQSETKTYRPHLPGSHLLLVGSGNPGRRRGRDLLGWRHDLRAIQGTVNLFV